MSVKGVKALLIICTCFKNEIRLALHKDTTTYRVYLLLKIKAKNRKLVDYKNKRQIKKYRKKYRVGYRKRIKNNILCRLQTG